jgi:Zn-dependent M28 family amino/carboxypeptidase
MLVRKSADSRSDQPRHQILAAVSAVSESFLRRTVNTLSIPRHFHRESNNNTLIGKWISDRLRSYGYQVFYQGACRNIVALPPGSPDRPMVLVGAHYDSVPGTPGADDNASGVAGLLACAKMIARAGDETGVCFVAFNREEDGLIGSSEFVEEGIDDLNLNIAEAHILEMIGYSCHDRESQVVPRGLPIRIPRVGNFLGLVGNRDSSRLVKKLLKQAKSYSPDFDVVGLSVYLGLEKYVPPLWRSDHAAFWKARIPVVMWTDTAEFRNPNYHSLSDTPETLDYQFVRSTTQLLLAHILSRTTGA